MNQTQIALPPSIERLEQDSIFDGPTGILLAAALMAAAALTSILMTMVSTTSVFPWLPVGIAAGLTLRYGPRYAVLGGLTLAVAAGGGFFGGAGFRTPFQSQDWLTAIVMIGILSVGHTISLALLPRFMGNAGRRIMSGRVISGDALSFAFIALPLVGLPVVLLTASRGMAAGGHSIATLSSTIPIILGLIATAPITIALLPDAQGRRIYRCHSNQTRRFIPAILMVVTMLGSWWIPDLNREPARIILIVALLTSFSWLATQSGWFACSLALLVVTFCEPTSAFGSAAMLLPIMTFGLFIAATMEERFRNDLRARDQSEQVVALLHATSAAMIEIDLAGRVRFGNAAAIDLLKSSSFPVKIGEPLADMFDLRSRRRLLAAIRVALSGRHRECEVSIRRGPSDRMMHLAVLTPLHRGSFGILGCSVMLLDLSSTQERARLRERRQEKKFSSLAHAIVHDVNNFAMEVGGVASLARIKADETVGEVLAGIEEKCLRAARRTDRIRHIVQIGDDARVIDVGLIASERLRHHHHTQRIRIGMMSSEPLTKVKLTESFARFIVDEFVENAIEASSTGLPEIAFNCRRTKDGAMELQIGDDGPGIPRSIRHQVGENFVSTKGGGRGLGLRAISAGVKSAGGRFLITSGEFGTVLKIVLPAGRARLREFRPGKIIGALAR